MLLNLERARRLLREAGLDGAVLATTTNVCYASGFASEYLLGRFEDWSAAVILPASADAEPVLVIQEFDLPTLAERPSWIKAVEMFGNPWSSVGVYMGETLERNLSNDLRRNLAAKRAELRPTQKASFVDAVIAAVERAGLKSAKLGCDDARLAQRLAARGLGGNAPIADILQLMRRIRIVKTRDEIALMTKGAEVNAKALEAVIANAKPGIAEDDLIRVYRRVLVDHDAAFLGERGMMFGAGDASAMSLPASHERRLTPGDAVVLDCLGTLGGYHMDLARTGVVGEPTEAHRLRYKAVVTALEAVEAAIKPGVNTEDLRKLTRDTIEGFGLRRDLVSVTTHGIGLEVFEFPEEDSLVKGYALEENMIVNTEVFYRDPDLGSFHLEDSVEVEATGCRMLRPIDRDLVVIA